MFHFTPFDVQHSFVAVSAISSTPPIHSMDIQLPLVPLVYHHCNVHFLSCLLCYTTTLTVFLYTP